MNVDRSEDRRDDRVADDRATEIDPTVAFDSEHAGATTPDEVADPLWWQGDATTDAPATSAGTVTGSSGDSIVVDASPDGDADGRGDGDSDADRSGGTRLDHTATASGSPDASITEFGAGHVLEPQSAFGRGDLSGGVTMPAGTTASTDPALTREPGAELVSGRSGADPDEATSTFEITEVPTFDDEVMTARRGDGEDEDEGMEYDPSLEPLE